MKQKQRMQNRKETNLLIIASTNNALKCSKGKAESPEHRRTKFLLSEYCWENSLDFATECVFKDNQRADFVVKDWVVGIEVLNSEKLKDFLKKKYPIPTIPIPSEIEPQELKEMMEDLETTNGTGADYYIRNICQIFKSNQVK